MEQFIAFANLFLSSFIIYLLYLQYKSKQSYITQIEILEKQLKKRPKSQELVEFMSQITAGEAMVSIHLVDKNDFFMVAPKDRYE